MKKSGASQGQSASELISKTFKTLVRQRLPSTVLASRNDPLVQGRQQIRYGRVTTNAWWNPRESRGLFMS